MTADIFRSARRFRSIMNVWPPYWGTGISVASVSPDFMRLTVQMKKRFYNSNAFGTHFGGSLYAMCDPFFVLQLVPLLGPDYVIWDRAATIDFLKPGRGTVTAHFEWTPEQLDEIRTCTADGSKYEPVRTVEIRDATGETVARVGKTLYVRRKPPRRNDAATR